jgi:hypothetical protein
LVSQQLSTEIVNLAGMLHLQKPSPPQQVDTSSTCSSLHVWTLANDVLSLPADPVAAASAAAAASPSAADFMMDL